MLSQVQPDIVSVCVSPPFLSEVVSEFIDKPPKIFFLEKPVVDNPNNLLKLLEVINKIPAAVNYHRCWDPIHINFFEEIIGSGKVVSIRVIYGNGMFNYASHLIVLLLRYFGKVSNINRLPGNTCDLLKLDPSLSFVLEFERGFHAFFQGVDDISYDLLELEAVTDVGIFSLKSAGCRIRQELPKCNAFYPDYKQLVDVPLMHTDKQVEGLAQAINNIVNYLDEVDEGLSCDLSLSLDVFKLMWKVKELYVED